MSRLSFVSNTAKGKALYLCDCGNKFETWKVNVKNESSYSCGCISRGLEHKLIKLADGSLESYYWHGFILADGHLTEKGRLVITLGIKDLKTLEDFNKFLGNVANIRKDHQKCYFAVNDKSTVLWLMDKYGLVQNKTYNPPTKFMLIGDEKTAFYCGFIDGDGSIVHQTGRQDCKLTIKLHSSWLEFLTNLMEKSCKINSSGYAYGCLADNSKIKEIKRFAVSNTLPIMSRKWDKINLSKISRTVEPLQP